MRAAHRLHGATGELTIRRGSSSPYYTLGGVDAGPTAFWRGGTAAGASVAGASPSDLWDTVVFHRVQLLEPRLAHTGWAEDVDADSEYACLYVGSSNEATMSNTPQLDVTAYPWPYNGEANVLLLGPFAGQETPDISYVTGVAP